MPDLSQFSKQDLLRAVGLEPRLRDYLWPALAVLGVGALIGAGTAALLTPTSGKQLRRSLIDTLSKLGSASQDEDAGKSDASAAEVVADQAA